MTTNDVKLRWRRLTIAQLSLLLLFLLAWPLHWLIDRYLGGVRSTGAVSVLVIWVVALLFDGIYIALWRCPRCGEPFNCGFFSQTPYRRKCQNCKLLRGTLDF
jgi:hypothetical protein